MITCQHRFALLYTRPEGSALGQLPLAPDWEPAVEWATFSALRSGIHQARANGTVVPIADARLGWPYAAGFRVELEGSEPRPPACDFPATYFAREARRGSSELVESGKLRDGDSFSYRLLTFPCPSAPTSADSVQAFDVAEETRPLAITTASLASLLAAAHPFGAVDEALNPVFIPQSVLDEAQTLVEAAGAREVGGILVGRIQHDPTIPDLGVVITAQIPARLALGEPDTLTFTAETWAAVEAAIRLRQSDEHILGWWHSHPARFLCREKPCPPEARRACPLQRGMFSLHDLNLHETVFAKAFQLALVVTFADDGCHHALYGWDQGVVRQRGYHVLADTGDGRAVGPARATTVVSPDPPAADSATVVPPAPGASSSHCPHRDTL